LQAMHPDHQQDVDSPADPLICYQLPLTGMRGAGPPGGPRSTTTTFSGEMI